MTDVPPLPVHGYKPQGQAQLFAVNRNKVLEEQVLRTLDALAQDERVDKRWLAIARTQIEQGFMAANRAIFQPGRAKLPDDPA